jgi:hypothetical protein
MNPPEISPVPQIISAGWKNDVDLYSGAKNVQLPSLAQPEKQTRLR